MIRAVVIRTVVIRTVVLSVALLTGCGGEAAPPELMPIGEFTLIAQDGSELGSDDLRGKVYVADFIFTTCPSICPVLSTQMANLHRRIDDPDVRFLSITVDPEHDTPEVMREYAARYRPDSRWSFLSGDPTDVRRAIVLAFRLPIGRREPVGEAGAYDITHGSRFVLVDRRGTLRGLYETDGDGLERLERDVGRLLEEAP